MQGESCVHCNVKFYYMYCCVKFCHVTFACVAPILITKSHFSSSVVTLYLPLGLAPMVSVCVCVCVCACTRVRVRMWAYLLVVCIDLFCVYVCVRMWYVQCDPFSDQLLYLHFFQVRIACGHHVTKCN